MIHTHYAVQVMVDTPSVRKPQLEEIVARFLDDLKAHEFLWHGGRVEEHTDAQAHTPTTEGSAHDHVRSPLVGSNVADVKYPKKPTHRRK